MATKKARIGRPPVGRKRVAVLLRMDPNLAEWYQAKAGALGRSRMQFAERCLARVRALVESVEAWGKGGADPRMVLGSARSELLSMLVDLGVGGDVVAEAWALEREEQRETVRAIRKEMDESARRR